MTVHFRAMWPIVDQHAGLIALIHEATRDLPRVAALHRVRPLKGGRWTVAPSHSVPGSGRVTEFVLIWDGPAHQLPRHTTHTPNQPEELQAA